MRAVFNKHDVIKAMQEKIGGTYSDSENALNAFIEVVSENIERGILIKYFGKFSVVNRKSRIGRNPKDNTEVVIPAQKVPVFKPSAELRSKVDKVQAKRIFRKFLDYRARIEKRTGEAAKAHSL